MFILAKVQGREFEFPKPPPKAEADNTIDQSEDTSEETENSVTKDTVKTVDKNIENAKIKDSYSMTEGLTIEALARLLWVVGGPIDEIDEYRIQ
ncbi:16697_t:CDS:2 [Racocetra persica]|uniref:16697_t:CDS:1 n=1 Tax=Racocetra persica TaxID=160502 RepID=A0ACA9KW05_9GLOM|nr:16697_t:CDS:2 [Racocetra persica]